MNDVVVVGGGVMGSAIAFSLLQRRPDLSVAVVERDPTYEFSSTIRCDGNVRIQFNLEENIRMSQYAFEVLATFAEDFAVGSFRPDPAARQQGNLFTVTAEERATAEAGLALQQRLGCDVEWVEASEISQRWPRYTLDGIVGATFGPRDGSVDPSSVLAGYRRKAAELGARYIADDVARVMVKSDETRGVVLRSGDILEAPVVVNAAGAWAAGLAETAGVDLPVEPVMRTVHVVESEDRSPGVLPSVFLPGGAYVIPEGESTYLVAWSLPDDPVGFDFTYSRANFYDLVWPEIIRHLPTFDRLRVVSGWTGLYAVNTLDGNAILGEWPTVRGFYLANGFSGHGFQQAPAVGRYLAELILDLPVSLDLSRLGPRRIVEQDPVYEHAGRII